MVLYRENHCIAARNFEVCLAGFGFVCDFECKSFKNIFNSNTSTYKTLILMNLLSNNSVVSI